MFLNKKTITLCLFLLLITVSFAAAAEHFGIPVYPGAISDAATARQQAGSSRESGNLPAGKGSKSEVFCYRTSDTFEKVVAYYKTQKSVGLLELSDKDGMKYALFCPGGNVMSCAVMGNGIDLGIMTPWEEQEKHTDVLIHFRKATKAK